MLSLSMISQNYTKTSFDATKEAVGTYLKEQGFTNIEYSSIASSKNEISKIYVNNQEHSAAASYPSDSLIKVEIKYESN